MLKLFLWYPTETTADLVSGKMLTHYLSSDVLQFPPYIEFKVSLSACEAGQLSTEESRQHAAVHAEHRVKRQQQVGIAKSLGRPMVLCQVLKVLSSLSGKPFYGVRLLQRTTRRAYNQRHVQTTMYTCDVLNIGLLEIEIFCHCYLKFNI